MAFLHFVLTAHPLQTANFLISCQFCLKGDLKPLLKKIRRSLCELDGFILPEKSGGQSQSFDLGRQAAFVAGGLVFMKDAFISHSINH